MRKAIAPAWGQTRFVIHHGTYNAQTIVGTEKLETGFVLHQFVLKASICSTVVCNRRITLITAVCDVNNVYKDSETV